MTYKKKRKKINSLCCFKFDRNSAQFYEFYDCWDWSDKIHLPGGVFCFFLAHRRALKGGQDFKLDFVVLNSEL